jgi:hypothetical protein
MASINRLTPTPVPPLPSGGVFGVPWLSDGLFGAVLGAASGWLVQLGSRRWGRQDKDRDDVIRRLNTIDESLHAINQALLRLELRANEQDEYIEPIRDAMKEAIKARFQG